MFREEKIELPHATLNVARGPAHGPPLVLLHGVVRRWTDYAPLLPYFTPRWEVLAVDFRGHGASSRTPGKYRVMDYVADIADLLNTLQQPAAVYGHSLGAMVALGAAAATPDQVTSLILEDPPFHTMGRRIASTAFHSQFEGLAKIVRPGRDLESLLVDLAAVPILIPGRDAPTTLGQLRDGPALRFMASCLLSLDPDVLAPIVAGAWLEGYDEQALAARVRCPTLVLEADLAAGGMLAPGDVELLGKTIERVATVRFPGIGHQLHWLAPDQVLRPTLAWLESTRLAGA
ncbi:MAG: alpha/beta hydrolase [Pirellulales bacterium]